ncbi:GntR family transcriptional regulator [Sinorhizobium medicae]|nr:GntR family transcriptional regulator [Sinorhizobium medicae]MDX1244593.1 GntR family transcriptional regulator [Sinorhizobium medicae]
MKQANGESSGSQVERASSSEILSELLLRICSLQYTPGQTLSETALAVEFGVSRTPIRQVLQQLTFFGLVESKNGVGTVVTELQPDQALELSAIRRHLALLFSYMSDPARYGDAQQRMIELEPAAVALQRNVDFQRFAEVSLQIQKILLSTITNHEFHELWERSYHKLCRIFYELLRSEWFGCVELLHKEIRTFVDAFASHDTSVLVRLLVSNIDQWVTLTRLMGDERREADTRSQGRPRKRQTRQSI